MNKILEHLIDSLLKEINPNGVIVIYGIRQIILVMKDLVNMLFQNF
ncbi:hypothetical protein [Amedibacillus sp. YH-ame6]